MSQRVNNSIRNSFYSIVANIVTIGFAFISRTVFIYCLNEDYLGVNGLFTNIISLLSLAELGVGTAIIYNLYKPLAEKNKVLIRQLVYFYKKVYFIIGYFILFIGIIMSFFIVNFMKEVPDISNLNLIFCLFVFNTVISYFFSYNITLLEADQKQYIVSKIRMYSNIVQNILQIIILLAMKNYILYLLVQIFFTITQNYILSKKAVKNYPYIKEKETCSLDKSIIGNIKKNTLALILHKIGSIVISSTDNLVISKFIGISMVGIYSNYCLVINSMTKLLTQLFSALTASVGNLINSSSNQHKEDIFFRLFFINFWIYSCVTITLLCLINPFIKIWIGKKMLLDISTVLIICINFFIFGIRRTVLIFRDAEGLYWNDRFKPVIESIINLVISVILVKKIGIKGVFIGTLVSSITTCLWMEPYVLIKNKFYNYKNVLKKYFSLLLHYLIVLSVLGVINSYYVSMITFNSIADLIFAALSSLMISNFILFVIFRKDENFKWIYKTISLKVLHYRKISR